jgi:hypothetical protein
MKPDGGNTPRQRTTRTVRIVMASVFAAIAVIVIAVVVLTSAGDHKVSGAPTGGRSDLVPFLGDYPVSCTWGAATPKHCVTSPTNPAAYHPVPAIDFVLPCGRVEVRAAGAGTVTNSTYSTTIGNVVFIYHDGDNTTSEYAHLSSRAVTTGQVVLAGQVIGVSGNTGTHAFEQCHLHYVEGSGRYSDEIWNGSRRAVDPGKMRGVKDGHEVTYPDVLGFGSWMNASVEPTKFAAQSYVVGRQQMASVPGDWKGWIVQWDGDTKQQLTSWLVSDGLTRNWIQSSSVFNCLKTARRPGPARLPSATLDALTDQTGQLASCDNMVLSARPAPVTTPTIVPIALPPLQPLPTLATIGPVAPAAAPIQPTPPTVGAPGPATPGPDTATTIAAVVPPDQAVTLTVAPTNPPTPTSPPTAAPTTPPTPVPTNPPPPTYRETVGGNARTWTNWTNAGGAEGPTIPKFATVDISCALEGFRVANGNVWWYRIASPPWSDAYHVSADAFYNNGATSGSLVGTPYVDPAVRHC